MRTKKPNKNRPGGDFRNNPFSTLKGFATPHRSVPAAPPADVRGGTEDEEELYRQAMSGARPLVRGGDGAGTARRPQQVADRAATAEPDSQLFLDAMRTIGTASFGEPAGEPETDDRGRRSSSSRMRRLRKGSLRIAQELDLHGFVKDEAIRRLAHFVSSAAAHGRDAVLVITGKGANSPGGPVLPAAVAAWLRGPGAALVAEFHQAPRDKGGSGAYVVFLRAR
jgi:DNA-nicking Smr family endonuclease